MTTVTVEQARSAAESLLGHQPERIECFVPGVGGDDSHSFRLWHVGQAMLLKIKKRAGSPVGIYFHRRIKEAGVPVPEIMAFSRKAGPEGQACVVWDWIDGVPAAWGKGQTCPYDEAELGRLLRTIHELDFDGPFGFLGDDPTEASTRTFTYTPDMLPVSDTWAGMFRYDRAAERYCDKGYLTVREADALARLPERVNGELSRVQPKLLHMGDIMHNGNLILQANSGRIVAVVDYVESMAGDPRMELAGFDYYFGQFPLSSEAFDMERFRAAYGADHDPDDAVGQFYLSAILVFEKLLFFKPGEPRFDWAIRALKRILAAP